MSALGSIGKHLAPHLSGISPDLTTSFVREALHRAIHGVGPLPPAAKAADAQLQEQRGNVDLAVREVIENHVRLAGAGGFVANIGGLVTAAFTIPANITGLALIECRMIAGIAHLRGYDLDDPRVRNADPHLHAGRGRTSTSWSRRRSSRRRRWRWPRRPPTTRTWTGSSPPRSPAS